MNSNNRSSYYPSIHLKIKVVLLLSFTLILPLPCFAQIVASEVPYYSHGPGIGISSKDSLFLLNIRFCIQNRLSYTTNSESDLRLSELETRIQRLRFRLDGFL
jgi:hypothetical protein